jgi:hypothetical protein
MANPAIALLAIAALALFATSKKKAPNGDEVEDEQETDEGPEGGETTEPVLLEEGFYMSTKGSAPWRIYQESSDSFMYAWKLRTDGPEDTWPVRSEGGYPTQDMAKEALFADMKDELGGLPDLGFEPMPDPGEEPPGGPGGFGQ